MLEPQFISPDDDDDDNTQGCDASNNKPAGAILCVSVDLLTVSFPFKPPFSSPAGFHDGAYDVVSGKPEQPQGYTHEDVIRR